MLPHVKQFAEIPGPVSLPIIGTLWQYIPYFGSYSFDLLHRNGELKLREFGPVVREEIVPGHSVVWIFEPEDVQELLRKEGRFPQRRSHLALEHLRLSKPHLYNNGGLLPTNGSEWWRIRSTLQKSLSSPQSVQCYITQVNEVLNDFIDYIKTNHCSTSDFLDTLSRLFLEILGVVAFDVRLKSFSPEQMQPDSDSSIMINAAFEANSCILKTDNGPQLWKYFRTPLYKRLEKAHGDLERYALQFIRKKADELSNGAVINTSENSCLIEAYLQCPNLDDKDVLGMAVDMILAGVDTSSYSSSFGLYHLAKNVDVQERLYQECCSTADSTGNFTSSSLANSPYVKAVLKETLRLNPISVGVGRIIEEDAIFSGYHVPKQTVVVTQSQVVCRQAKFFKDPDNFAPERWLKDSDMYQVVSPYLSLPFGHGSRACIARRLAEQNMQLLLMKMVYNFKFTWTGNENLGVKSFLINKPDGPILLDLEPRRPQ